MKKLIAKRSVLYLGRMYDAGAPSPPMTRRWSPHG